MRSSKKKPANAAGYSGTPLVTKLGIAEGSRVVTIDAPRGFTTTLGKLPAAATMTSKLASSSDFDVIVFFVTERSDLEDRFGDIAKHLQPAGGFWIAWPKKASGVATDVTENVVREIALAEGLVDNKVCAIDEVWSGLRCVIRLKDR